MSNPEAPDALHWLYFDDFMIITGRFGALRAVLPRLPALTLCFRLPHQRRKRLSC